jgi:hypothetical protein
MLSSSAAASRLAGVLDEQPRDRAEHSTANPNAKR